MSSLYKLDSEWDCLQGMIEDGDTTEEEMTDHLEAMGIEFADKAHGIGCVLRNMTGEMGAAENEIDRLKARVALLNEQHEKLSGYLLKSMIKRGEKKVKTSLFTFSYRKPTQVVVIDDLEQINECFRNHKPATWSPMRNQIAKALKEGHTLKGAHLEDGTINLSIK